MSDILKIGERSFNSRLMLGTGKYKDFQETDDFRKFIDKNLNLKNFLVCKDVIMSDHFGMSIEII